MGKKNGIFGGRGNRNVYTILVRKSEGKRQLGRHRNRGQR
jgi:hypothetical protein